MNRCVCPLPHQLHTAGRTWDLRGRPPPSPFCSSRLILSSFCPRCQLALSPPFSASLGTQCHCPRPPWLSLGRSWDRLRTQAGKAGCSLEASERAQSSWFVVLGAGSLAGLRHPEALASHPGVRSHPGVPHSFPDLSPAAGAGQPAPSLGALETESTIGQRKSKSHLLYQASKRAAAGGEGSGYLMIWESLSVPPTISPEHSSQARQVTPPLPLPPWYCHSCWCRTEGSVLSPRWSTIAGPQAHPPGPVAPRGDLHFSAKGMTVSADLGKPASLSSAPAGPQTRPANLPATPRLR